jgi:predicted adenine nucleotide alpha hydrolase (AANH) superfamily ATPase
MNNPLGGHKARPYNHTPTLLLHSCCAPCSSYVLEHLRSQYRLTLFYFNPNITDSEEYQRRLAEQKRLLGILNEEEPFIDFCEGEYAPERFFEAIRTVAGAESEAEGGERCFKCYELRLGETAQKAAAAGFDYFATTLTLSPRKNAAKINEIGEAVRADNIRPSYLPSDFKKKGGYQRSLVLSQQYSLYRQNYCGCEFSRRPRTGG